jgi:tetraacyldisaccharide 4'-kinase
MALIERIWYGRNKLSSALLPLSWVFGQVARRRRNAYLEKLAANAIWRPPVPVIVVGNISVGGTGKTPVVIAIVEFLQRLGYQPGVVARGYGGKPDTVPLMLQSDTSAAACGDEPLLLQRRTGCPVVIDPDRPRAVRHLLQHSDCDVVVSDDGMQHYALYRDIELAVVDSGRGLGNGHYLPAGPLREAPERLTTVDAVLLNGGGELTGLANTHGFRLEAARFFQLSSGRSEPVATFNRRAPVHALAGIGNPSRFFDTLEQLGFDIIPHAFPDHHAYTRQDIDFDDDKTIVMTEKDAVKCNGMADQRHWYLAVNAVFGDDFLLGLEQRLQAIKR